MKLTVYEIIEWNYILRMNISFHLRCVSLGNNAVKLSVENGTRDVSAGGETTWFQFSKTAGNISHPVHLRSREHTKEKGKRKEKNINQRSYRHKFTQGQQTASAEFPRGVLSWHTCPINKLQTINHCMPQHVCWYIFRQHLVVSNELSSFWLFTNIGHTLPAPANCRKDKPTCPLNIFD